MPKDDAAGAERSMMRPGLNGPRSVTRTMTERPDAISVTSNCVPNGSDSCAAVSAPGSCLEACVAARYQEARPVCMHGGGAAGALACCWGAAHPASAIVARPIARNTCMPASQWILEGEMMAEGWRTPDRHRG